MTADELKAKSWYWIRRPDGTLAPYVFHRISRSPHGRTVAEFFVGSFLVTFELSQIEAEAQMPAMSASPDICTGEKTIRRGG